MSRRTSALLICLLGLGLNFVGKIDSLRETSANTALTGASVVVIAFGLYRVWQSRSPG